MKKPASRGNGFAETLKRLGDSHAQLAQAQATLVASQALLVNQMSESSKRIEDLRREANERFAHIETILLRLVEVLPEAVRDRIGLNTPDKP